MISEVNLIPTLDGPLDLSGLHSISAFHTIWGKLLSFYLTIGCYELGLRQESGCQSCPATLDLRVMTGLGSWLWDFHLTHLLNIGENTHPRNVKITHRTRIPWITQQHADISFYTSKRAKRKVSSISLRGLSVRREHFSLIKLCL